MIRAKGNSGDMVIKFIDESIDATKYLPKKLNIKGGIKYEYKSV